jgi:hypothetical protein
MTSSPKGMHIPFFGHPPFGVQLFPARGPMPSAILVSVLISLFLCGCTVRMTVPQQSAGLADFLNAELRTRPVSDVQDIYKLLYQGSFGVGHLIASREQALSYLDEEMRGMEPAADETLIEPCNPEQTIIRVNLRPFLAKNMAPSRLVNVMLESTAMLQPDTAAFVRLWAEVGTLIERGMVPLDPDAYATFTAKVARAGYPAVHHSAAYARTYTPAYRVVLSAPYWKTFTKE